jgi:hypothetical protein
LLTREDAAQYTYELLYETLGIKHIQLDTLGHLVYDVLFSHQLGAQAKSMIDDLEAFHVDNRSNTLDFVIQAFTNESYSKVKEFLDFQERLQLSLTLASVRIEQLFFKMNESLISPNMNSLDALLNPVQQLLKRSTGIVSDNTLDALRINHDESVQADFHVTLRHGGRASCWFDATVRQDLRARFARRRGLIRCISTIVLGGCKDFVFAEFAALQSDTSYDRVWWSCAHAICDGFLRIVKTKENEIPFDSNSIHASLEKASASVDQLSAQLAQSIALRDATAPICELSAFVNLTGFTFAMIFKCIGLVRAKKAKPTASVTLLCLF